MKQAEFNEMVISHEEHIGSLQHQMDDHKNSDIRDFGELKSICNGIKEDSEKGRKEVISQMKYILDANAESTDNKYQTKEDNAQERLKTAIEVGALSGKVDNLKTTIVTGISVATGILSIVLVAIEIYRSMQGG